MTKFCSRFLPLVSTIVLITACSNDNSGANQSLMPKASKYDKPVQVTGLVRNEKKQITKGRIAVKDSRGSVIAKAEINDKAHYAVEIPAQTNYPVEIIAYPDKGQSEYKSLKVAVIVPPKPTYDITPTTTTIADQARALGGYNYRNLVKAARNSVAVPKRDKTVEGFRGDYTKQYGGWH